MSTITAIIPTFNEALHITDVIASLQWCDRIIVIDSFSKDETLSLAQAAGAEVVQRAYQGPAEQKNHAITLAETDWVVILDADERVTPELESEIVGIIHQDQPAYQAYWIGRRNHFLGKEVKYSGWQGDKVIRLFKRGQCVYGDQMVHEEMECTCEVGMLKHKLLHYTYRDMPHYLEKFDRYTTWSAQDRQARTGKVTLYHLWIKPLFRFFRHYILRGGILDGQVGFIISVMSGYSVFLRYLKIDRLQKRGVPVKVLHLSSERTWRGGEQQMAYLIESSSAAGVEVQVMARAGSAFATWCRKHNVPLIEAGFSNGIHIPTAIAMRKAVRDSEIDFIHIHSGRSHDLYALAHLLGMRQDAVLSRRVDFPVKQNMWAKWKYKLPNILKVVCVSEAIRVMTAPALAKPDIAMTVHSGVDLARFEKNEQTLDLKKELGIAPDTNLVINVSALAPHKDLLTFVRCAKAAIDQGYNMHFALIGEGSERGAIEAEIDKLGLSHAVSLTGFRNEVIDILRSADVMLMTSKTEGLGTTILDAFAVGLPVVATAAGGIPESVIDGETGLLYSIGDATGLARGLKRVCSETELRNALIQGAKAHLTKQFTKEIMASRTLAIYEELKLQEAK